MTIQESPIEGRHPHAAGDARAGHWRKRLLAILPPVLGAVVLVIVLIVLHDIMKEISYHDLAQRIRDLPRRRILTAMGLTALSYLILTCYDTLGARFIGRQVPYHRTAMASFIGYAFNNNLGFAGIAGNSLRYRIYTAWGLSAIEIAKVIAFCVVTFWIGFFTIGGLVFLIDPPHIPAGIPLPPAGMRTVGALLLVPIVLYFAWSVAWHRPVRIRDWVINLPPTNLFFLQMILASLDWVAAGGVLYLLLPSSLAITFGQFMAIYLLAAIIGLISHVPGGLAVFETVVGYSLHQFYGLRMDVALGAIIVYRVIYYFLPFALAVVLLAVDELLQRIELLRAFAGRVAGRIEGVRQTVGMVGQWLYPLIPNVFAIAAFAAGAVLLFSGATPSEKDRLAWLENNFSLSPWVIQTAHVLASMIGVALLLLARGLQRRLETAYHATVLLLGGGIAFSLLKGFDYEEALVLSLVLAAFVPCRPSFYRRASLTSQPIGAAWVLAVLLVLALSVWLGIFSYKHVTYTHELWARITLDRKGDAGRFLRATVGAVCTTILIGLRYALRPAPPEPVELAEEDWAVVRRIVAACPRTYAYAALFRDKYILFNPERTAFIMYGIEGRSWVALGDPVGPESEMGELVWQFREMSDRHGGWTVFYHVPPDHLPIYLDLGLTLLKLGEEAMVPLAEFGLEGSGRKGLRHSFNRAQKEGCRFEILPAEAVPELLFELKQISDAWLADKNTREKSFSLGFFDETYLKEQPVAIVRQEGRLVAFANLWCGAEREELSIDMMRYIAEAHVGIMDYLFIELMLWGREEGYKWFNLGMAPLSGLENRALAPLWARIGATLYRHGEHFYNFQGLRQYKEKYDPVWMPKYLAAPGGLVLPRILTNVAALIAGGVRGIVTK